MPPRILSLIKCQSVWRGFSQFAPNFEVIQNMMLAMIQSAPKGVSFVQECWTFCDICQKHNHVPKLAKCLFVPLAAVSWHQFLPFLLSSLSLASFALTAILIWLAGAIHMIMSASQLPSKKIPWTTKARLNDNEHKLSWRQGAKEMGSGTEKLLLLQGKPEVPKNATKIMQMFGKVSMYLSGNGEYANSEINIEIRGIKFGTSLHEMQWNVRNCHGKWVQALLTQMQLDHLKFDQPLDKDALNSIKSRKLQLHIQ